MTDVKERAEKLYKKQLKELKQAYKKDDFELAEELEISLRTLAYVLNLKAETLKTIEEMYLK